MLQSNFTPFFGKSSIFSNHYTKTNLITFDNHSFSSSEQLYYYRAANHLQNSNLASAILRTNTPLQAKHLVKQVPQSNFQSNSWKSIKVSVMREILSLKFSDPELRLILLQTTGTLVECNEFDRFWSCGLHIRDKRVYMPNQWLGSNILGRLLTEMRDSLLTTTQKVQPRVDFHQSRWDTSVWISLSGKRLVEDTSVLISQSNFESQSLLISSVNSNTYSKSTAHTIWIHFECSSLNLEANTSLPSSRNYDGNIQYSLEYITHFLGDEKNSRTTSTITGYFPVSTEIHIPPASTFPLPKPVDLSPFFALMESDLQKIETTSQHLARIIKILAII